MYAMQRAYSESKTSNMKTEEEKAIEKKLNAALKLRGGWGLKLLTDFIKGLPDRLCLLPGGVVFFVEVKTTKKRSSKMQIYIHSKLRNLGFSVYVLDNSGRITEIIENERNRFTRVPK